MPNQNTEHFSQQASLPDRLLVMYRTTAVDPQLAAQVRARHGAVAGRLESFGIAVVQAQPGDGENLRRVLAARPEIAWVAHDRVLQGSAVRVRPVTAHLDTKGAMTPDSFYTASEQDWAVKQAGGYGARVPGGPAHGAWDASMGNGVTIAIVDSGVDSTHPDIAPNLVGAASLVDQSVMPSPCDDGSPQDQDGHGTWAASLAAGALGARTGLMVGVAPQAELMSVKVLERMPAAGAADTTTLCTNGAPAGLMSWVLAGIEAASAAHADIISLSVGGLLDTYSGEDAGLIAMFDRATYQATQNGSLVVAALGNDGQSLDNSRYMEMPAQATDVVAVMASTNPACAQNLNSGATCQEGSAALAYYSNYGVTLNAVAAPGGSYPETSTATGETGFVRGACSMGLPHTANGLPALRGHSFGCFDQGHAQYVEAMGTSAAAPLVAGVAALIKGAQPHLSPTQIANLLRTTASLAVPAMPQVSAAAALSAAQ